MSLIISIKVVWIHYAFVPSVCSILCRTMNIFINSSKQKTCDPAEARKKPKAAQCPLVDVKALTDSSGGFLITDPLLLPRSDCSHFVTKLSHV